MRLLRHFAADFPDAPVALIMDFTSLCFPSVWVSVSTGAHLAAANGEPAG